MAELAIPQAATDAAFDLAESYDGDESTGLDNEIRRIASPVVAQFLRDLAAKHDRVTGGLLAELADELDGQS